MPDGRTLYFEYDAESAWEFRGGESGQRNPRTAHNHGESDPSAAFWLEFLCFHSREGKTAIVKAKKKNTKVTGNVPWTNSRVQDEGNEDGHERNDTMQKDARTGVGVQEGEVNRNMGLRDGAESPLARLAVSS
jgi:hypothetical protein